MPIPIRVGRQITVSRDITTTRRDLRAQSRRRLLRVIGAVARIGAIGLSVVATGGLGTRLVGDAISSGASLSQRRAQNNRLRQLQERNRTLERRLRELRRDSPARQRARAAASNGRRAAIQARIDSGGRQGGGGESIPPSGPSGVPPGGNFGRARGRAGAYTLSNNVLFPLLNEILRVMRANCPVRTGRLKRSIHADGQPDIRNGPPTVITNISPEPLFDGEVLLGGDTSYMQYVSSYHAAVKAAAEAGRRYLRTRSNFRIGYNFTNANGQRKIVYTRVFNPQKLIRIEYDDIMVRVLYPTTLVPYFTRNRL